MPTLHPSHPRLGRRAQLLALATMALAAACGDDGSATSDTDTDETETSGETGTATTTNTTTSDTPEPTTTGTTAVDSTGTDETETGTEASLFDRVVTALGGAERLEGLETISLRTSGNRYIPDEGPEPDGTSVLAHEFDTVAQIDLTAANMRLDHDRVHRYFIPFDGAPLSYSEVLTGQVGFFDGSDSVFAIGAPMAPPPSPMLSDRWAAIWRQERLLHPQLLLRELLASPGDAVEAGEADYDGRPHELLELPDPIFPITLWIDSDNDQISRLTTVENSQLRRDSELELVYQGWNDYDGLLFPDEVELRLHGTLLREETRTEIALDGDLDASFELPAGVEPTFVEDDAARGDRSHQFHHMGSSWGLPSDGINVGFVNVGDPGEPVEVTAGVHYLRGTLYNTIVIEQDEGLVIFEAPLYPQYCEEVLDWIDTELGPGAPPITHVVLSHHHQDHTACARVYVEQGASVVVGASAQGLWEEVLGASSTIVPDPLEGNPLDDPASRVIAVGADPSSPVEINPGSTLNPIRVYPLANDHSSDMIMGYLPDTSMLFVSDLCNPAGPGMPCSSLDPSGPPATYCAAEAAGIANDVAMIAGGHGGPPSTGADFQAVAPPMGCE
ncbi:MAG: MBL fold metallo-hydrolase [Myxococcota bacterium]